MSGCVILTNFEKLDVWSVFETSSFEYKEGTMRTVIHFFSVPGVVSFD